MHRVTMIAMVIGLFFFSALAPAGAPDDKSDWPQWRGVNYDATAMARDIFRFDQGSGLKATWKKPLGSGYSSVSVMDGFVVTMFSDSTYDYTIAFDAKVGKELWRYKIDSTYVGHDGSHDGPISTPLIEDGKVYSLAPRGQFFAVDLKSGKKVWSTDVVKEHHGQKPLYGFSTSPLMAGDVLILETGGQDSTISGFNKDTGKMLWSTGNDTVSYQSPLIAEIAGEEQLLCIGDKYLYGLEPETGEVLWEFRHGGGWISSNPVMVDDSKIFLNYNFRESMLLEVNKTDTGFVAQEVWKTKGIKRTYSIPVYHEGHVYGYNGTFLTCVDVDSGKTIWKSRQPGDGFLILVDGHLVIQTKKGTLHIAKATPEGYEEVANLDLFDFYSWTPPSFANGSIYARSLGEIARVDVAKVKQVADLEAEGLLPTSKFAQWVKKVESTDDKKEMIDKFMNSQKSFPVTEGDKVVHFIYRGEAEDMGITGDMLGDRRQEPMHRVAGTDLFYYSMKLKPDASIGYQYIRNLEETLVDSLNTKMTPTFSGEKSLVMMPEWQEPDHLKAPPEEMAQGRVDTMRFESEHFEQSRRVDIYTPPGYDDSDMRYPVAYIHWGDMAQNVGKLPTSLDNLIVSNEISPIIAVFINTLPGVRGEWLGPLKDKYSQMLAEELVPYMDKNFRTISKPEARANIGMGFAGYIALYSTFKHPRVFDKVSSQSTFMLTSHEKDLRDLVKTAGEQPLNVYLDWGTYDYRSVYEQWDMGKTSQVFAEFLKSRGYKPVTHEVNEAFGWAFWRNRTDKIFEYLFPV